MKHILIFLIFLLPLLVKAQDIDSADEALLIKVLKEMKPESELPPSPFTLQNAKTDITTDSLKLVVESDVFTSDDALLERQFEFSDKYNVTLVEQQTLYKYNKVNQDIDGYNKIILNHLIKKYGDRVRTEFEQIKK